MLRIEILSNKSIEEDITDSLEQYVPGILYTKIPVVYGRGGDDYKLGTTTWPETNFALISYIEDKDLDMVKAVVKGVKERFKREGVKLFVVKAEEL